MVALFCLFLLSAMVVAPRKPVTVKDRTHHGDIQTFRRIIQRMQAGEGYYEAFGTELREGGYNSRSVFNWRSPLHLSAMAFAPDLVSRACLVVAGLMAVFAAAVATHRAGGSGPLQLIVTGLAVSECFLFGLDFHLFPEVWAGVLISLSVTAYAFERELTGVGFGTLALFVRELAFPYVVVSLAIALWRRRRIEAQAWIAGLCAWGAYFLVHAYLATSHMRASDTGPLLPWLQFGGPRFLVTLTKMSPLCGLPDWVAALSLTLMLLGVGGWKTGIRNRVSVIVGTYMTAFTIIGMPVNFYWGAITNPLLAFGLVWSLPAVCDLARVLRRSSQRNTGPVGFR